MSIYGVFSGPYFLAFGLNTERYGVFSLNVGKYGPEKTRYLDTSRSVYKTMQRMRYEGVQKISRLVKLTKYLRKVRMFLCLGVIDLKVNSSVKMLGHYAL